VYSPTLYPFLNVDAITTSSPSTGIRIGARCQAPNPGPTARRTLTVAWPHVIFSAEHEHLS
jgi:hypothetical protein